MRVKAGFTRILICRQVFSYLIADHDTVADHNAAAEYVTVAEQMPSPSKPSPSNIPSPSTRCSRCLGAYLLAPFQQTGF